MRRYIGSRDAEQQFLIALEKKSRYGDAESMVDQAPVIHALRLQGEFEPDSTGGDNLSV